MRVGGWLTGASKWWGKMNGQEGRERVRESELVVGGCVGA